jgi:HEAT repeat protein
MEPKRRQNSKRPLFFIRFKRPQNFFNCSRSTLSANLDCFSSTEGRIELVRYEAANALSVFGTNAKAAIPELMELYTNHDKRIYQIAAKALKAIDAEAAAKTGVE